MIKKMASSISNKIKHNGMTYLLCFSALIVFCMFTLFKYIDFEVMTVWTVNFWDLVFEGRLMDFYEYTIENIRGITPTRCRGNYLWLIPWCVWNFPIWIYCTVTGTVKVSSCWMFYWSKLYMLLLIVVIIIYICKIAKHILGEYDNKLVTLLILMSPEILMSAMYAGQDEVQYLALYIMGLYYFMEEKITKAYICAAIASVFCPQMLIPFLVLLVIREKNVVKICSIVIGTMIPLVVFELIYGNDSIYTDNKLDLGGMLQGMLGETSVLLGNASIMGVLLVIILFFCYVNNFEWNNEGKRKILFINTLVFCAMSVYVKDHFYRLLLYVPFVVLIIILNKKNFKMNMFLFLCLTWARVYVACKTSGQQNMNTVSVYSDSWYAKIAEKVGSISYGNYTGLYHHWVEWRSIAGVLDIFADIIVFAAMLLLLYINLPQNDNKKYDLDLPAGISILGYVLCMPIILAAYFKILLFL